MIGALSLVAALAIAAGLSWLAFPLAAWALVIAFRDYQADDDEEPEWMRALATCGCGQPAIRWGLCRSCLSRPT